jgi:hypothetical protein
MTGVGAFLNGKWEVNAHEIMLTNMREGPSKLLLSAIFPGTRATVDHTSHVSARAYPTFN